MPQRMYDGYIFDLDGTIYLGSALLPGAYRLIIKLRELGKRVVFLSNNPTRDVQMYVDKLTKLGLPTPPEEIVTTVFTTTQWILQNAPDAVVYPDQRGAAHPLLPRRTASRCRRTPRRSTSSSPATTGR